MVEVGIISRQRGVTLVELLVVMAILAFAAGLVALNAPPVRSIAKEEAERFAARARAAWEDSVVEGSAAAIAVSQSDYRIERYVGGAWRLEPPGRRFSERRMPESVIMLAKANDPAAVNAVKEDGEAAESEKLTRIILDPIGLTTPFEIEFRDGRERWLVRNLADETLAVTRRE